VSFLAGVTYGVAFLPPIGRFRLGLTQDVFVLITFEITAIVIGVLAGRHDRQHRPDDVLRAVSHGVQTDEAQRAELVGIVVSETERRDRIVGNLLNVTREQSGSLVAATSPR
jgi:K+-sensing histidine kinase KdpD